MPNKITLWSIALLHKLTVAQLLDKHPSVLTNTRDCKTDRDNEKNSRILNPGLWRSVDVRAQSLTQQWRSVDVRAQSLTQQWRSVNVRAQSLTQQWRSSNLRFHSLTQN